VKPDEPSLVIHVPKAVSKIKEVPSAISLINLPESTDYVSFAHLWGDRLYTEAGYTLNVYSLIDLTSPCATYTTSHLRNNGISALITENRLYLGGWEKLRIFEVTPSLTEPLTPVTQIIIEMLVYKILRVGDDLLLG
jgi:hypothetical protein